MRLAWIELTNFKRHQKMRVDFQPGSNMIIGPNYSGKTSLIEGILVGMFGNSMASCSAPDLVRTGANDFEVALAFTTGLLVRRSLKNSSAARGDEKPFVRGHTAVNDAIAEELGMGKQTFLRLYTSLQGSPQMLLQMEGAELQRFMEQCLGLERLDEMVKYFNQRRMALTATYDVLKEQLHDEDYLKDLRFDISESSSQLRSSVERLESLKDRKVKLGEMVETQLEQQSLAEAHNASLRKYLELKAAFDSCTLVAKVDVTPYLKTKAQLATVKADLEKQADLTFQLTDLRERIKKVEKEKSDLGLRPHIDLQDIYNRIDALGSPEFTDIKPYGEALADASESVRDLHRKVLELNGLISKAKCPTCKKPFNDDPEHLNNLRTEIADWEAKLEDARSVMSVAQDRFDEVQQANTSSQVAWEKAKDALDQELRKAIRHNREVEEDVRLSERLEASLGELRQREEILTRELYVLPPWDLTIAEVDRQIEENAADIRAADRQNTLAEESERRYEKAGKALGACDKPESLEEIDLQAIRTRMRELLDQQQALSQDILTLTKDISAMENRIEKMRQELSNQEKLSEQSRAILKDAETHRRIRDALANSRERAVNEAWANVLSVTSEFAKACTDGDIEEVLLNDGAISYKEKGVVRGKLSASGAQKTLIGLGMKLGLATMSRTPFDCLILDEVSADMDPDVSMRCALMLGTFCGQTVSVSHREMDVAGHVVNMI